MGQYHLDEEVEKAFIRLLDSLCTFERSTFRDGLLVYIPENKDEKLAISWGGKPHQYDCESERENLERIISSVISKRYDPD